MDDSSPFVCPGWCDPRNECTGPDQIDICHRGAPVVLACVDWSWEVSLSQFDEETEAGRLEPGRPEAHFVLTDQIDTGQKTIEFYCLVEELDGLIETLRAIKHTAWLLGGPVVREAWVAS